MKTLIVSPHDDDAQLFCCFTAIRTKADVAVILDSYLQPARGEIGCSAQHRAAETERACLKTGCQMVRCRLHDDHTSLEAIIQALEYLRSDIYDVAYSPAYQVGGNEQHNLVSRAVDQVFGSRVFHYSTYTKDALYTTGAFEVIPTEEELRLKNDALYCFESQLRVNMPHFKAVLGKSEWLDRDPSITSPVPSAVPVRLHLGCGKNILPGYINVDRVPFPGVDLCGDITKGLPYEDNSFDYICSQDWLEHIPPEKKVFVINECWRLLKPGGIMEHNVPDAGSQNDFGSPTHLSHWSLQQFDHWNVDSYRYEKDREFEGIIGGFKMIVRERVNLMAEEDGIERYQSIHVKMAAVKE